MSTVFIVRRFLYKRFKFIVRMFLKKYKKDLDFPSQRLLSNYKEYERVKYSSGKKDTWEGIMSEIDKQNKSKYKIRAWQAYNKNLHGRGDLYFS